MRICIITDNKKSYASKKFLQEARLKNIAVTTTPRKAITLSELGLLLNKKIPLTKFDAVILRSSKNALLPGILITEYCKHNGVRLLNETFYLRYQTVNKLRQQLLFQTKKLPHLKTLYGENISFSLLKKEFGVPFVAKFSIGSLGRQVFKVTSKIALEQIIKKQKDEKQLCLFQKFYPAGIDYRVFIVGEKIFGPMKRFAPAGEWKTNIPGSKHARAEKEKKATNLARLFLKKTGIEFAGLDILIDSSGKARLIEINTMACFEVFEKIFPEINIAKETIALLEKSLRK
jgi:ribosomal protein S6--L-glutamate ligase